MTAKVLGNQGPGVSTARSSSMREVTELKVTVMKLAGVTHLEERLGLLSPQIMLVKTAQTVVTDRLIVTDEGVRVMDVRE